MRPGAPSMNRSRNALRLSRASSGRGRWRRRRRAPTRSASCTPARSRRRSTLARCRWNPMATCCCSFATTIPDLATWQRDLLTIVDEEARYFIPQMETKIMNEGWASYWHHKIMSSLDLPQEVFLEFMVRHNQVICPQRPQPLSRRSWSGMTSKSASAADTPEGRAKMMVVRESDRDVASCAVS
ncbi:MAG: SpoVR family protein [Geminicoccaceae bacterium]